MSDLSQKPYNLNTEQITYIQDKVSKITVQEKIGQLLDLT